MQHLQGVREKVPADVPAIEQAKAALTADWPHFVVLEIDQALVALAGDYADTFALRGYDSVQLAAAYKTVEISQVPVFFACYDIRLNKAPKLLGLLCH